MTASLEHFLRSNRGDLEVALTDHTAFLDRYGQFLHELVPYAAVSFDEVERALEDHGPFLRGAQQRALALQEADAVEAMLHDPDAARRRGADRFVGQFARDAYERVGDLSEMHDFSMLRRVVVAGSGALPSTVLWLVDHLSDVECVGLDIDPGCVETATKLAGHLELRRTQFQCMNAQEFDFRSADFVFVANQVRPKGRVLERIAATIDRRTPVVVREPTALGRLLAEPVLDRLPPRFTVLSEGIPSSAFLSYDVFLDVEL